MKHLSLHSSIAMLVITVMTSCSTVKVLQEDQRRLTSNKISVLNDKKFNSSQLNPYLKQKSGGWSPFLYVYNWENGKGKGWDRFVHKLGMPPVIYDSTLVKESVENISDHLRYIGYYNSEVTARVDSSKFKKAKVRYLVNLGRRFKISDIHFSLPEDNEKFAYEFYSDTANCTIRRGEYLSEQNLEKESARSAAVMHNNGYYDFNKNYYFFEADTMSNPGYASLDIIVREHTRNESSNVYRPMEKYNMGRISVTYPEDLKFREKALRNLNILKTGDLYNDSKIQTQYARFNSISYFNAVNIHLQPNETERLVDCDIQLTKSKTQGFKAGLEASLSTTLLWGISPEINYFHKNLFHGGEHLNVSVNTAHQFMHKDANVQSHEVTVAASLTFPTFFPFPTRWITGPDFPKTEIKASYNFQSRPEYRRHIASASFGYTGQYRKHFIYQVYPVSFNSIHLPYIDPAFWESIKKTNQALLNAFQNHLDLGLTSMLYYNSSESFTNPKDSYWYTRLKFDLSGNLFSAFNKFLEVKDGAHVIGGVPYSQYVKVEWEIGKTFVMGKKGNHSLSGRFLLGYGKGYGNSLTLPFEKRFFSGGANSLRGWVARTVGPGTSKRNMEWKIPNQSGDMKLEANLEYRFKIFWKFSGAVFADAGNIWEVPPVIKDTDPDAYFSFKNLGESLAADWGVGLRLDLNFILLRLDFGMRFHDPALDKGDRWVGPNRWFKSGFNAIHFGVGYPF